MYVFVGRLGCQYASFNTNHKWWLRQKRWGIRFQNNSNEHLRCWKNIWEDHNEIEFLEHNIYDLCFVQDAQKSLIY